MLRAVIYESVLETLSELGDSPMNALMHYLGKFSLMNFEYFDIRKFEVALRDLIGQSTDGLMEMVLKNIENKLGERIEFDPKMSPLEKILKLVEMKKEV